MWYNGASTADPSKETLVGHATSSDGVQWTRFEENRPALDVAEDGGWDDYAVARASVLYDGELYKMWYEGHSGGTWRIGYALSTDGVHWERTGDSPIVELGSEGAWDSKVASEPCVLFDGHTYWLYHSGYDGDRYRVGLVTAPAVYEPQGTFVSPPISSTAPVEWGRLTADLALHAQTDVGFEVATSENGQTWSDWTPVATELISGVNRVDLTGLGLPHSRFLRYRATLTTSDPAVSPLIREIVVSEAAPDYGISVSRLADAIQPGQRAEITISLSPLRGFDGAVYLDVQGQTEDVVAAWPPGWLVPPASISLVVGAGLSAQPGTTVLTITAASGDIEHSVPLPVIVGAPPDKPTSMPTPTPISTPAPPPLPTPLPPVDPQPLWVGGGIVGGGLVLALIWVLLLALIRPAARGDAEEGGKRRRRWWRHPAWLALSLALLAAGLYLGWQHVEARRLVWEDYRARIRPGVHVAGIDAGGMTGDEIRAVVEARSVAPYRREIVVRYGGRTTVLGTTELDLRTNLDQIVEQAVAVGQESTDEAFRAFLTQNPAPLDVHLPLTYTFDYSLLSPWVETLAREVQEPAVEHTWDPETLTFVRGRTGVALDSTEAIRRLETAVPDLSTASVELPLTYTMPRAWTDDEIASQVARAGAVWNEPPVPAAIQQITIPFDYDRWIGPNAPESAWMPTRTMTGYVFLPGQMGWTLDVATAQEMLHAALEADTPVATTPVFADVEPGPLTLNDIKPVLLEIAGHFDGYTGLYVQDLASGEEIRHNTYVTTSGMSMIKVAIMVTAYRTVPRPFTQDLHDAMSQMIAHSINRKSNAVILAIGDGDFQLGLRRVNETLQALGMHQTYIASAYRVEDGPAHAPIPVPERPGVEIPAEEQVNLWPDTAMQTSLSDQVIIFQALYQGAQGSGLLLEAFPGLTPEDCQEMLDLLKTNPTRTLLGPGFADDVPIAHKNGFGGGQYTDERMDIGIVWPPNGRPYLVGLYQWDSRPWIHWLRVWPQQIELSTTLCNYFTMPATLPAQNRPK
jgi:beta-lactamase class A